MSQDKCQFDNIFCSSLSNTNHKFILYFGVYTNCDRKSEYLSVSNHFLLQRFKYIC